MSDYISREAVLAQKGDCYDKDGHLLYAVGTGNILLIPAADVVEVRHGCWIKQPSDFDLCGVAYYQCSECGKEQQTSSNYCQFCGAKMDGEQAADAVEKLNKEVMDLRSNYWDVTCDPEYRECHFEKDEWGE